MLLLPELLVTTFQEKLRNSFFELTVVLTIEEYVTGVLCYWQAAWGGVVGQSEPEWSVLVMLRCYDGQSGRPGSPGQA